MAECSVVGCGQKTVGRGLCKLHYYRMRRNGCVELSEPALPDWASEVDIAYAAGFIDADGSIMIERGCTRGGRHTPRICAAGIELKPLEFLRDLFGGHICPQRHRAKNPLKNRFTVFQWSISSYRAVWAARLIMPYLRIKSVQAYLLSCFDYEAIWSKGGSDPRMPIEEFQRREDLVEEMRSWNGKDHLESA